MHVGLGQLHYAQLWAEITQELLCISFNKNIEPNVNSFKAKFKKKPA